MSGVVAGCDWASCSAPATVRGGVWLFCAGHLLEHEAVLSGVSQRIRVSPVGRARPPVAPVRVARAAALDGGVTPAAAALAMGLPKARAERLSWGACLDLAVALYWCRRRVPLGRVGVVAHVVEA